ncbi:MAG TPA: HEAT repeat domain-containing protein [Planctomycetota bacterium]|nr:HEAT repeat domain-containing protein [Planctomycetota bacterium]
MSLLVALLLLAAPEDLLGRLGSEDASVVIEACREAATSAEPALTAPLIKLLKSDNPAVRTAAVEALALRKPPEEKKKAAQALAQRVGPLAAGEETKEECVLVANALHDLAQPVALKALLDGIGPDDDRDVAKARMRAAANIPSKDAIEELIHLGSAGRRGGAQWRVAAVIEALRYATQERVEGGIEAWRQWWTENRKTFDVDIAANKRADARLREEERRARKGKKGARGEKGG